MSYLLDGLCGRTHGFNMAVADGAANDKLCFQAKLHEVVHYLSPYWPRFSPSLPLSPSLVLSLTFLFNYLMSPLLAQTPIEM